MFMTETPRNPKEEKHNETPSPDSTKDHLSEKIPTTQAPTFHPTNSKNLSLKRVIEVWEIQNHIN